MKTDRRIGGGSSARHYRHPFVFCITQFLSVLQGLPDPAVSRRVWWTPLKAAIAAVLMTVDRGRALGERFHDARACMSGDFARRRRAGTTYNGLLKALERQGGAVLPLLKHDLRRQARRWLSRIREPTKWLLLAVDGSKEALPRTRDQESSFGIADNGAYPQALLSAIVEVHTGLLWDWRVDRGRGSEKAHLVAMAADLPDEALLLADGNFIGFGVWSRLNELGKSFLIRVGGNVRLLTDLWPDVESRCSGQIVYVWPKALQRDHSPLMLRLIRVGSGRRGIHLLTNVLEPSRLSRRDAGMIYRQRWGAELFFRTFKRSLGYAKLRSRAGRRARIELEWALVASMIMTMMGLDAAKRHRVDPQRISPTQVIRTLHRFLLRGITGNPSRQRARLYKTLVAELKDRYQRRGPKHSRHRPVTTSTPKPTLKPPKIRKATPQERTSAKTQRKNLAL